MNRPWHKFYPEGVPYEIDLPLLSLYDLLANSTKDYPHHKAVIDGDREMTYAELKRASDRFASSLHRLGFEKGDRIAVMLPNCLEYIIAYYGIQRLGGVLVQLNPMYQQVELEYILRDSETGWFISHREQLQKLELIGFASQLKLIFINAETDEHDFYRFISKAADELPPLNINPQEDLAVLQYTGGTTGRSKGVMLTHYNLVSNVYQSRTFTGEVFQQPGERFLSVSPFFHVHGMTSAMNLAIFGAGTIICLAKFGINHTLSLIAKHKPTFFPGVPTMYIALLRHPDVEAVGIDCIKLCNSGSAPMPVEVMHEFEHKTGARIIEGYGLSETSPVSHRNPVQGLRKPGSIGLPMPNTDAKIVDVDTGTIELPIGEAGELIIKGPQVMKGYWKKPEETHLNLRDGWLYSGDIAKMDEDGYFYIVGRKKDLIIAGGYNIYPIEIEDVVYQHPAVSEACVFGVPHSYRGETVKVVIVPKPGMNISESEIVDWCGERLARYKVPQLVEFRNQLPKTTVGKILRRKLVEEEMEQAKTMGEEKV